MKLLKLTILFTTFLFMMSLMAQGRARQAAEMASDEDLMKTFSQEEVEELDSLKSGSVLQKRDFDTGLFLDDYNTYKDLNRVSFLYHLNNDLTALTNLQTVEFNWAHRFDLAWVEFFFFRTQAKFEELTENNPNEGGITADLLQSDDSVLAGGASISYRGNWVGELFQSDKVFSTISAGLGWYRFSESLRGLTYSGPGLKCDFGVHRRSSRSIHYGMKMSYHLSHTKRAAEFEGESSSARSQVLSWLSLGFDLSFYF
jgi:hypothetical protein